MSARVELRRDCPRLSASLGCTIAREHVNEIWGEVTHDPAPVVTARGEVIGWGQVARKGDVAVRMIAWGSQAPSGDWLEQRIVGALSFRRKLAFGPRTTGFIAVCGEGDGLPGLDVERYEDITVVRLSSVNMLGLRHRILDALAAGEGGRVLIDVTPQAATELGGRAEFVAVDGQPLPHTLTHREDGIVVTMPCTAQALRNGHHSTREARRKVAALAQLHGGKVLELGCHVGGFSLHAAARGLATLGVDADALMLQYAQQNSRANHLERPTWLRGDYYEGLLRDALQGPFGTVIWDPPTFDASPRDLRQLLPKVTQALHHMLQKVAAQGFFVWCHRGDAFDEATLDRFVSQAALTCPLEHRTWTKVGLIDPDLDAPRPLAATSSMLPRTHVYRRLAH